MTPETALAASIRPTAKTEFGVALIQILELIGKVFELVAGEIHLLQLAQLQEAAGDHGKTGCARGRSSAATGAGSSC